MEHYGFMFSVAEVLSSDRKWLCQSDQRRAVLHGPPDSGIPHQKPNKTKTKIAKLYLILPALVPDKKMRLFTHHSFHCLEYTNVITVLRKIFHSNCDRK